jgi:hypothetical protein
LNSLTDRIRGTKPNWSLVKSLSEQDEPFDALIVDRTYRLIDGRHRSLAAKSRKDKEILCIVVDALHSECIDFIRQNERMKRVSGVDHIVVRRALIRELTLGAKTGAEPARN